MCADNFQGIDKVNNRIPEECDWGNWVADLDQKYAHDLYLGRSNEEMKERYTTAPIEVASELQFMPVVPFQYYMVGFADAVVSGEYDEMTVSEAPSCFLRLIIYKLKNNKSDIESIMNTLLPFIEHVVINQEKYDADIEIYGDFNDLLKKIRALWNS